MMQQTECSHQCTTLHMHTLHIKSLSVCQAESMMVRESCTTAYMQCQLFIYVGIHLLIVQQAALCMSGRGVPFTHCCKCVADSPQWRPGFAGCMCLCNACGTHLVRARRAIKEGKKKDPCAVFNWVSLKLADPCTRGLSYSAAN